MTEPETGLANYVKAAESTAVTTSFVITFRVAALTTVFCVVLGSVFVNQHMLERGIQITNSRFNRIGDTHEKVFVF